MKKAQGISVNVIIIAAIALLVLVILSVIYIGRMGDWGKKTNQCTNQGGRCFAVACGSGTARDFPYEYPLAACDGGTNCCMNITK